jgi:hypothetical protein
VKYSVRVAAVAVLVFASQALQAGISRPNPVPTLGEAGLVALAIGLAGGGVTLIRRRRP